MSIFEKASRQKLRFASAKGGIGIGVDDLWDLPLQSTRGHVNLDDIAKALNRQLKAADGDVSFVDPERKSDERVQLALDVVRHVIGVKMAENAANKLSHDKAAQAQRIMEAIEAHDARVMSETSREELVKKLEALKQG